MSSVRRRELVLLVWLLRWYQRVQYGPLVLIDVSECCDEVEYLMEAQEEVLEQEVAIWLD